MQKLKGRKSRSPRGAAANRANLSAKPKLKRKDYEAELRKLHVELVKLQEWVRHEGQKVCIVFEGRDGAGKGGVIKAITARVSPRNFPGGGAARADRAREVADVHSALPAASAGRRRGRDLRSQLVQSRRRRARHGLLHGGSGKALPQRRAQRGKGDRRFRRDPAQVLARGEPRGADKAARGAHRRRAQDLEALQHGSEVVHPLGRLLARRATTCSWQRIPRGRPGTWRDPTTSGAPGSTSSATSWARFLTRTSRAKGEAAQAARVAGRQGSLSVAAIFPSCTELD